MCVMQERRCTKPLFDHGCELLFLLGGERKKRTDVNRHGKNSKDVLDVNTKLSYCLLNKCPCP